jgi:hypothetical protein
MQRGAGNLAKAAKRCASASLSTAPLRPSYHYSSLGGETDVTLLPEKQEYYREICLHDVGVGYSSTPVGRAWRSLSTREEEAHGENSMVRKKSLTTEVVHKGDGSPPPTLLSPLSTINKISYSNTPTRQRGAYIAELVPSRGRR